MSDEKKSLFPLKVDYSNLETPEEIEKRQEACIHKTVSLLDVAPETLHNKYGIPFKKNIIHYICEDCGKMFGKVKK